MKVVMVAAECAPLAKVGGLGEVVMGLSLELKRLGVDVEVILPKYDFLDLRKLEKVHLEIADFKCFEKGSLHANAMWSAKYEGINFHLLEARHPAGFFHRGKIYGCEDDTRRFIYFCRAVMEYLKLKEEPIDLLHVHDWHMALIAVFSKDLFSLPIKKIVLSIHNAAYQGKCATWDLDAIGLKGYDYLVESKMQDDDPAYPRLINLLKGGVVYSDAVITVSESYAKEILTKEMGYGLDPTFRKEQKKIYGILNGLDLTLWNPKKDPALPAHYEAKDSIEKIEKAKETAKALIASRFHLSLPQRPWIGTITRLVEQKGPELIEEALLFTLKAGGVFLLLGSSPTPKIQTHFSNLKAKLANHQQALLHFEHDETLSRQLYAALDFFVIPSLYEPCGLTQMIAMRYGTIPIARATGGLKDTILDQKGKQNGFLFPKFTKESEKEALERAFQLFREDPTSFQSVIKNAMSIDWGWEKPTQKYVQVYRKLLKGPTAANAFLQNLKK